MKTLCLAVLLSLTGCATSPPWVPLAVDRAAPDVTLVWVGRGLCERMEDGVWVRRPEFDYDFTVEQRRMGDRWESVKHMRRLHPDYDGSAGERAQTYFFVLGLAAPDAAKKVAVKVTSSLGHGQGTTDVEFRNATLEFSATGVSSMAPFDRYRIVQHYDYEAGQLSETVELNDGDAPWVRNQEKATLFAAHRFEAPPTVAR